MATSKAKAAKPKAAEPYNPAALQLGRSYMKPEEIEAYAKDPNEAEAKKLNRAISARAMSQPEVRAASVIQAWDESLDVNALAKELREQVEGVGKGSLARPEAILTAQAHTLDALFGNLARRSQANASAGYTDSAERYMRLALKAQAQAVRTIEALGELKHPRSVAFVKQANIANNQQINNGQPVQGENFGNLQSKLSEGATYELLQDTRASQAQSRLNPPVATLEAINRATDTRGEREGFAECQ